MGNRAVPAQLPPPSVGPPAPAQLSSTDRCTFFRVLSFVPEHKQWSRSTEPFQLVDNFQNIYKIICKVRTLSFVVNDTTELHLRLRRNPLVVSTLPLGKTTASAEDLLATVLLLGTLLLGDLVDLLGKAVTHETVTGLELLHGDGVVVDEAETSALATTVLSDEAEDGDSVLLGLVVLGETLTELVLGHVGARGVEDVNDELRAAQERVALELSDAESHGVRGHCVLDSIYDKSRFSHN